MARPSPAFTPGQSVRLLQDPELGILTIDAVHWSVFQTWAYDLHCPDGTRLEKVFETSLTIIPLP